MTTVGRIAAAAYNAVSAAITDAISIGALSDGTTHATGRVIFDGQSAPKGFPSAKPADKVRPAYLEGFGVVPESGWTITANGGTYYITDRRDIVEAGSLVVCNVIADADLFWLTADVKAQTRTSNGAGGYTEAWSDITDGTGVKFGIWATSGLERNASGRVEAVSQWRGLMPYLAGVDETCRIVADGRIYNVRFVDNVQRRGAWLVMDLEQGAAV